MSRLYGDWDSNRRGSPGWRVSRGMSATPKVRDGFAIEFTNMHEINALLEQLPEKYAERFVKQMIKRSIVPMTNMAKRLAPVSSETHGFRSRKERRMIYFQPGTLLESLGVMDARRAKFTTIMFGPLAKGKSIDKIPFYAWFVEEGHRTRSGDFIEGKRFMQNAFDMTKDQVITKFKADAKARFEATVKRWTKAGKI